MTNEQGERPISEEIARLSPKDRFQYLLEKSTIATIATGLGVVSAAVSSSAVILEFIEKLKNYFFKKTSLMEFFISSANAASEPLQIPAFSGILKSAILAGIFALLFVLFIWALFTLYRSPNAKAVDVASEAVS